MLNSRDGIQTTHVGSLPRTPELVEANAAREVGEDGFTLESTPKFESLLTAAVTDVVQRQKDVGITVPNDGEFGHAMSGKVDYGAWWSYSFQRLSGLELTPVNIFTQEPVRSTPGNVQLTSFPDRRDWTEFHDAYVDPTAGVSLGEQKPFPTCTGPLTFTGHDQIKSDIDNLGTALDAAGIDRSNGYLNALSVGSCARLQNDFYATEEEFLYACADALREEYLAITNAGFTVQIDGPEIAENWDQVNPEPTVEDYIAFTKIRVEALNHALRGIPEEQIRFHLCWGSWHGPHTTDLEMKYLVDTMLEINAGAYSFEAANVRHEHEWQVWQDTKLPDGKLIIPGVVSHATNVVEHPELVADRIERFAAGVGRENVIASTDCGLGGRIHPQIAWAKLDTLAKGTEIATKRLWK